MSLDIIERRLRTYSSTDKNEELHALKEISQEVVLSGLARSDFFKKAAFQGGTCLRIVHGLQRYSEDLDFVLLQEDSTFNWASYFTYVQEEFKLYGLPVETTARSQAEGAVKKAFLKQDSFGQILELRYPRSRADPQVIRIKLEIDTRPPNGSRYESHIIHFPTSYSIVCQDLSSLFAGKCHALLCRQYTKGRDWYDLLWYAGHAPVVNASLLEAALEQQGPWNGSRIEVTNTWLRDALSKRISQIDFSEAAREVSPFLQPRDRAFLEHWSAELFERLLEKLNVSRCS